MFSIQLICKIGKHPHTEGFEHKLNHDEFVINQACGKMKNIFTDTEVIKHFADAVEKN